MPTKPAADVFNHHRDFGGKSFIHKFDIQSCIDKTLFFVIILILRHINANKYLYRFIEILWLLLYVYVFIQTIFSQIYVFEQIH